MIRKNKFLQVKFPTKIFSAKLYSTGEIIQSYMYRVQRSYAESWCHLSEAKLDGYASSGIVVFTDALPGCSSCSLIKRKPT